MPPQQAFDVDVAVVGGGLSGLVAARELRRRGASVVVLEARDRVGGKLHTVSIEGAAVDLGAHWVGPGQKRILALADELGIAREPQYLDGRHVALVDGERLEFTGSAPVLNPLGTAEAAFWIARLELRRRLVSREQPWRTRGARRLDDLSLAHWSRRMRSRTARATLDITARTVWGCEPSELSLLYVLWYAQSAGGMRALMDFEGGAQDSHLVGGSQQVCERLAAELGDAIALGSPVTSIAHDDRGVTVTAGDRTVRAGAAVVAVSPALAARIAFEPVLPAPREALAQRMPMGAYMKAVAVYEQAWWRDRGLSGMAFSDRGPVQMIVDTGPPSGSPGVLVAFVTGASARVLGAMTRERRRAPVVEALVAAFGPQAARPVAYRDVNWHEERWSRGAPVGVMAPGTMTGFGPALFESLGPIHWAGTDTATEWCGFMEGAIQAGERAAAHALT